MKRLILTNDKEGRALRSSNRGKSRIGGGEQLLTAAASLFGFEPSAFSDALGLQLREPTSRETQSRLVRLRKALLGFRKVLPDVYCPRWAHDKLPRWSESPLDILQGANGFDEFVHLLEGIARGDFA